MKAKNNSYEPQYAVKDAPKTKTVGLQFGVTDRNLEAKIKRVFDLAKSGGRELDLTFSLGHPRQSAFRQVHLQ